MQVSFRIKTILLWITLIPWAGAGQTQTHGVLRGQVVLDRTGDPLHHASVLIVELARRTETDAEGRYEFLNVPPGRYSVVAHMHPLADERKTVEVPAGASVELDFRLVLAPVHEEITVTASGREQPTMEAFQAVSSLELLQLTPKAAASLGEVLEGETGVAKRSYGPGSSRPVIRGFDGDRVLILEDGLPTGTLSSQSGDHGEPVNVAAVERVEVVRGPATLLYGANALGGVVNVITGHHQIHQHPHEGVRGFLTGSAGSNNALGGVSGGVEAGKGRWLASIAGGGLRTGDYRTPLGPVVNSHTSNKNVSGSIARYGDRWLFHAGYGIHDGRYGIPDIPALREHRHGDEGDTAEQAHEHAEGPVDLKFRRQNVRLLAGIKELNSWLQRFTLNLNYSDWNHRELVGAEVGTEFFNRQLSWRGVFDQRDRRQLRGSLGFQGLARSYRIRGAEQLTPPVKQYAIAAFGLEEFSFERFRLQLGGRLETNQYRPQDRPSRGFTGASGSAGLIVPAGRFGSLLASFSHSYRAPAIEELYNYGPHHGNLAFEIGDPNLTRESAQGIELAWRTQARRLRGEVNTFYYRLNDYVYLAPTGEIEHGLIQAHYRQADSRYMGGEARMDIGLRPDLWLKLGFDAVDAQLRASRLPLPRIPPARGRIGFDARFKGFSFEPTLLLAAPQSQLYFNETRTPGYAVLNLNAGYVWAQTHVLHSFHVIVFNAADRLYRNHVSLIKDYAPEIGRGVRFAYTLRFF
jgi:iron complex outermembrane receptor protein